MADISKQGRWNWTLISPDGTIKYFNAVIVRRFSAVCLKKCFSLPLFRSTNKIFSAWLDEWGDFLMSYVRIIQASAGNEKLSLLRLRGGGVSCAWRPRKGVSFELHLHPVRALDVCTYFQQRVCTAGALAGTRRPTFSSRASKESYFSFALILKVKSE